MLRGRACFLCHAVMHVFFFVVYKRLLVALICLFIYVVLVHVLKFFGFVPTLQKSWGGCRGPSIIQLVLSREPGVGGTG